MTASILLQDVQRAVTDMYTANQESFAPQGGLPAAPALLRNLRAQNGRLLPLQQVVLDTMLKYKTQDPFFIMTLHPTNYMVETLQTLVPGSRQQYAYTFATHTLRGLTERKSGAVIGFYSISKRPVESPAVMDLATFAVPKKLMDTNYPLRLFADACALAIASHTDASIRMQYHPAITPLLVSQFPAAFPQLEFPQPEVLGGVEGPALSSLPITHTIRVKKLNLDELRMEVWLDRVVHSPEFMERTRTESEMTFTKAPTHVTIHNGWATWSFLGMIHDINCRPGTWKPSVRWASWGSQLIGSSLFMTSISRTYASSVAPTFSQVRAKSAGRVDEDKSLSSIFDTLAVSSKAAKRRKLVENEPLPVATLPLSLPSWAPAAATVKPSYSLWFTAPQTSLYYRRWYTPWLAHSPGPVRNHHELEKRIESHARVIQMPNGIIELLAHGVKNCPVEFVGAKTADDVYFQESDYERVEPLLTTKQAVPMPLFGSYNGDWYMMDGGHRLTAMTIRQSNVQFTLVSLDLSTTVLTADTLDAMEYPKLFLVNRVLNDRVVMWEVLSTNADSRLLPSFAAEHVEELKQMHPEHSYFDRDQAKASVEIVRLPDLQTVDYSRVDFSMSLSPMIRVMDRTVTYDNVPAKPGSTSWETLRTYFKPLAGVVGKDWTSKHILKVEYSPGQQISLVGNANDFWLMHDDSKVAFWDGLVLHEWTGLRVRVADKHYSCACDVGAWCVREGKLESASLAGATAFTELKRVATVVSGEDLIRLDALTFAKASTLRDIWIRRDPEVSAEQIVLGSNALAQLPFKTAFFSDKGISLYE